MEWYHILEILAIPLFSFIGGVVGKRYDLKGKKLELEANKNTELVKCQDIHSERLDKVRNEFKSQLSEMNSKIDTIIKKQLEIDFRQKSIEDKLDENRDLIQRTANLEKVIAVLDNREKVSEHRLDDLEKHNEKETHN